MTSAEYFLNATDQLVSLAYSALGNINVVSLCQLVSEFFTADSWKTRFDVYVLVLLAICLVAHLLFIAVAWRVYADKILSIQYLFKESPEESSTSFEHTNSEAAAAAHGESDCHSSDSSGALHLLQRKHDRMRCRFDCQRCVFSFRLIERMAAIKDLFQRLKLKTKFKQAGPGVKLSSAASPALSPRAQQPPAASARPASAAGGGGARALTSEQSRAAEAAAQRAAATPRGVPTAKTTAFDRLHEEAYEAAAAQQQQPLQWLQQREGSAAAADAGASDRLPLEVNIRYTCELLPGEKLDKREMQARIEEYLGAQLAGEAPAMAASLIVRTLNKDAERVSDCIETILKYIDNVLSHPGDEKYTKIRVSNRAFQERVASQKGAVEFLQCAGFELRKCLPVAATSAQPSQAVEEEDHFVLPASIAASPEHLAGLKEVLASAEPVRPQLDPDVRLYRAPHSAATSRFRELPADFFRLSEDEIRREQQARVEALEKAGMLRTRAMRERDERRELSRYRYAVVRVRLPGGDGGLVLQVLLHASDRLQALRDVVAGCLRYDWLPFRLTTSGGGELADAERTLAELQLAPASVVNMLLDAAVLTDAAAQLSVGAVEPGDILRPELLDSVGTLR